VTIGSIRSGLVESEHPVSVVAVDADGAVIAELGADLTRDFFLRSAPKPLQAAVAQRYGADLNPEQLAVAASSHSAFPVHVAHVEQMLDEVGLDTSALLCPPSRPSSSEADRLWAAMGRGEPERVFHNCSGKHAGMLRACVAQGWSLQYTDPQHPLHREIIAAVEEASRRTAEPVGVDGCGIPTLRSDVIGLARVFSVLVNDPRYTDVAVNSARLVALTADGTRPEAKLTRWVPSIAKGGAEGCIGLGMLEHGLAFAAKCWTGSLAPAVVGLVALMVEVGVIPEYQLDQLDSVARPHVFGGGRPVGSLQPLDS
jgi:L-asparaginase II